MPDRADSAPERVTPTNAPRPAGPASSPPAFARKVKQPTADSVLCERCGTAMFRMHAVWRCPSCGYKTDCCGW